MYEDKGGWLIKLLVFGSVVEVMEKIGVDVLIIFVLLMFVKDVIIEVIDVEILLLVVIIEGILVQDIVYVWVYNFEVGYKICIIGFNCFGIISFGQLLVGIMLVNIIGFGLIGLVFKLGMLIYQMMFELCDFGFFMVIGIGGDLVIGIIYIDVIEVFERDLDIKFIVMIGEIGGDVEEWVVDFIKINVFKLVVGYVVGFIVFEGKMMGYVGVIVFGLFGIVVVK